MRVSVVGMNGTRAASGCALSAPFVFTTLAGPPDLRIDNTRSTSPSRAASWMGAMPEKNWGTLEEDFGGWDARLT